MKVQRLHSLRSALLVAVVYSVEACAGTLPGDATIGLVAGDQASPAIARGNEFLLAVWSDARANLTGGYEGETSRDIYGVRLDLDGNLLDAVPFAVTASKAAQDHPKVAWNGTHWLVVFESYSLNGTGYYYERCLEAVRVTPTGQVLDDKPIRLNGLIPSGGPYWALASDGANWVVVNQGTSTSAGIVAVRIAADGAVLDPPTRTLIEPAYYMRSNLRLAYAAGVFLLTFNDFDDTMSLRFDGNLVPLDSPSELLASPLNDIASNDSGFYIVWYRQQPDFSMVVAGSRVSSSGQMLDGPGINISGTHEPHAYAATVVAWDGANWRVNWGDGSTTFTARVNSAGQALDAGGLAVPDVQTGPSAGNGQGGVHLVWTAYASGNNDVFTAVLDSSSMPGSVKPLSIGAPSQNRADVAASGAGYMLVYSSATAGQTRVLAQPLDPAGVALTLEPIELDAGASPGGPTYPNVAWNGSCYLVTWGNISGIVGQRLLPDGATLDPTPFVIMSTANKAFGSADVSALGENFLVVGRRIGINAQYIFPAAARVRGSDGAVLDAVPLVLGGSYVGRVPAVVALGEGWLAAFHQNSTHDDPYASTRGTFVNPDGTFSAPFTIHGPFSTAGGNGIFELALASSGSIALMVQSQELSSGVETDLLARLINPDGTVEPMINLTPWIGNQYKPRAAWDGTQFTIVYQDQKNRLADWTLDQLDARSDLFGMRVAPNGTVLDPQGFLHSASPTGETDPTVAASNGVSLLVGSVMVNDSAHANYRLQIAQQGTDANAWPVAVAAATPADGIIPLLVTFSAAGSHDLDGTIVSYEWDFGDGAASTQSNPSHTYFDAGPYVAILTVTDDNGAATRQTVLVKAVAPNQLPIAAATADSYAGVLPLEVVFSAAGSYDPDGLIGNVEWLFSDGSSYWGATAYHTFTDPGPQTVTLNCYDAHGGVGTTSLIINADGVNRPPVAVVDATPTSGYAPLNVQFSSAGSYDSDGTIVAYEWTFGDSSGEVATDPNTSHTYLASGTYQATLTVWDDQDASHSTSIDISLSAQHYVEYGLNLSLGSIYYEHYQQGEQGEGPIDHEEVISDYGRVAGQANVGFGVNKARVELSGTNPADPLQFEYGFATSRYWDVFQFDDPQLDGTHGFFDITLFVAGSGYIDLSDGYLLAPETEFGAFWHAVINVWVDGVYDPFGSLIQSAFYAGEWYKGEGSTTLDYFGDPLNSYQQTVTIEFIYGQPIFMDSFLQVDTNFDNQYAQASGTLDAVLDLGNSSYWGGIRNLRDAAGNPVTGVQYSSSSGFDYRSSAVPSASGDMDGDGDIDADDFTAFAPCMGGPGRVTPPLGCSGEAFDASDLDEDGDTDLGDAALFHIVFGG